MRAVSKVAFALSGILGLLFVGWLGVKIVKPEILPTGALEAWASGFGIIGGAGLFFALGLAFIFLAKPEASEPPQTTDAPEPDVSDIPTESEAAARGGFDVDQDGTYDPGPIAQPGGAISGGEPAPSGERSTESPTSGSSIASLAELESEENKPKSSGPANVKAREQVPREKPGESAAELEPEEPASSPQFSSSSAIGVSSGLDFGVQDIDAAFSDLNQKQKQSEAPTAQKQKPNNSQPSPSAGAAPPQKPKPVADTSSAPAAPEPAPSPPAKEPEPAPSSPAAPEPAPSSPAKEPETPEDPHSNSTTEQERVASLPEDAFQTDDQEEPDSQSNQIQARLSRLQQQLAASSDSSADKKKLRKGYRSFLDNGSQSAFEVPTRRVAEKELAKAQEMSAKDAEEAGGELASSKSLSEEAVRSAVARSIASMPTRPFSEGVGQMSADEINSLWGDYLEANKQCGRDVSRLTPSKFKKHIARSYKAICSRFDCDRVGFSVKIKKGKVSIQASPRRS